MSAITDISIETLARVRSRAENMGLSTDAYIRSILPLDEIESDKNGSPKWQEFEADMADFAEEIPNATAYRGSYSREDIYFDHD